ncbi:DUF664 domain-containing protein [Croceivirga thetidis]|uniref:DUF664 domain-containing protein n=1 Tax=Croceivirga thetidis TaxID=2721623 RepID=A0ABX1GUK9_9FLAO|nr:DUF664 domain-containing protein [Croceivirga thetidis]NKI32680.1 DUF664 domain-containing protein [Croceivirga thetidis]
MKTPLNRRKFIQNSSLLAMGAVSAPLMGASSLPIASALPTFENMNIIGPREGFSPNIGTLVSMMNWMREVMLSPVRGMSISDLDYLIDDNANTIGAMLMHLAATERFYQINTFDNKKWGDFPEADLIKFGAASMLGDRGRAEIKGKPLDYYLEEMTTIRENTLSEFKKRDDDWLFSVDGEFPWGPTNNYCKWFHVCEHESNHNGVFKFLKSRIV